MTDQREQTPQRERRDSNRCVDCETEQSKGWVPAGLNRVRCAECHVKQSGGSHES